MSHTSPSGIRSGRRPAAIASDALNVLVILLPNVMNCTSTRVACVVRALILSNFRSKVLGLHPNDRAVRTAAEEVNTAVLSLNVKAYYKEKMGGKTWRSKSRMSYMER